MKQKVIIALVLLSLLITNSGTAFAQGSQPPLASEDARTSSGNSSWLQPNGTPNVEFLKTNAKPVAPVVDKDPVPMLTTGSELVGATSTIINGDFEQGQNAGWSEFSSQGYEVVVPYTPSGVTAHSGSWIAWLGDADNEVTILSQSNITISGPSVLKLWYWSASDDDCGWDYGSVKINNSNVHVWDLCYYTNTYGWFPLEIDLSAYQGQTVTLSIEVRTDEYATSGLLIDDVSFVGNVIAGNVGVGGATVSYVDGTAKAVTSQGDGSYSLPVSGNWSGTVTPTHPCYTFSPLNRTYNNVTVSQTGQNYTPTFTPAPACANTVGVFRPTNGLLYLRNSNTTGFADVAINYGLGGDYPVVGDWDGDGDDTIGVYRNGMFLLRNSNTLGFADIMVSFGQIGDQPIAGDWDGDGDVTIGVYRPSIGLFLLRNSNTAGAPDMSFYLGNVGDVGIAGDWNGDGIDTTGVFRPSNGILFLKNTNATGFADIAMNYGLPGDRPVVGDWDNNGTTTIGIYRNARFYLRNSNTNGFADILVDLGINGDMPIAGNWDGIP